MKKYSFDAIIIGSGCAGLNCADTLYDLGYKNIAIVTENLYSGTSRNTGSDKQTYYKISLSGKEDDSIEKMLLYVKRRILLGLFLNLFLLELIFLLMILGSTSVINQITIRL